MLPFPVGHWGGGRFIDTGSNRYAERLSGLSGAADGTVGTFAMFAKLREFRFLLHIRTADNKNRVRLSVSDVTFSTLKCDGFFGASSGQRAIHLTANPFTGVKNNWAWYGWSWNVGASRSAVFSNDSDRKNIDIFGPATNIEYSGPKVSFYASNTPAGSFCEGCFAYVFFSMTTEYDFNIEANRRLFLNGDGSPVTTLPSGGIVQSVTGNLSNNEGSGGNFDLPNGAFLSCVNEP